MARRGWAGQSVEAGLEAGPEWGSGARRRDADGARFGAWPGLGRGRAGRWDSGPGPSVEAGPLG